MKVQALGLIETYGYIGAIEAADVCLKAANVSLLGIELVKGGLVTVMINGEVGAVSASVDAARAAVEKVGKLISTHVIPRPAVEVLIMLYGDLFFSRPVERETNKEKKLKKEVNSKEEKAIKTEGEEQAINILQKLKTMKVVEMRSFARELKGIKMNRGHIKFAKREELLKAILDYYGIDGMD